jgi:hypothetical protein
MRKSGQLLAVMAVLVLVPATPALAQATRTWVSGVGDDANPCSRTAPCRTFAGAISKTATGGEINVIDPGAYGAVTITKSITLRSEMQAGVLVSANNGIIVNAGAAGKVVIDGLDFEGLGTGSNAINVISGRDVLVRNSNIRGFATAIRLSSTDLVNQTAITVEHCTLFNNGVGVLVDSTGGNGSARVFNSLIAVSSAAGIRVSGTGNKVEISNNQILRTPLSLDILSGATVNSYGDNVLGGGSGNSPTLVNKG